MVSISAGGASNSASTSAISISSAGFDSNGVNLNLSAGTLSPAALTVAGSLSASATGIGNGGHLSISYSDPANALTVGGSSANSFVNGSLTADALYGTAGSISFANNALAGSLNVNNSGTIRQGAQALGNISLYANPVQNVVLANAGTLNGVISGSGQSIAITSTANGSTLTIGNLFCILR